jgi:hypothetical protein
MATIQKLYFAKGNVYRALICKKVLDRKLETVEQQLNFIYFESLI